MPYFTNAAGPNNHSPLPIEVPRIIAPGPMTPRNPIPLVMGGAGSSATDHGARPDCASFAFSLNAPPCVDLKASPPSLHTRQTLPVTLGMVKEVSEKSRTSCRPVQVKSLQVQNLSETLSRLALDLSET